MRIMKERSPSVMLMLDSKNDAADLHSKAKQDGIDEHTSGKDDGVSIEIPITVIEEGLEVEYFRLKENQENEGDWVKANISKLVTSVDHSLQSVKSSVDVLGKNQEDSVQHEDEGGEEISKESPESKEVC